MGIKIGDIVKTKEKYGNRVLQAAVIKVHGDDSIDVLFGDGEYGYRGRNKYTATGKHIDMQSVLDSIEL